MSCSYILTVGKDLRILFFVWPHSVDELDICFDYINKVDPTKNILFTMEVATSLIKNLNKFL